MIDFSNYKMVSLASVANYERAQKGKIYPPGCTLIALSATKGQVEYMNNASEVDSRWAVVIPAAVCEPKYIYYSILRVFPQFCHERKTGINFQFEELKHLEIGWHPIDVQKEIVRMFEITEQKMEKEEQELNYWKNVKKNFLARMFLTNL